MSRSRSKPRKAINKSSPIQVKEIGGDEFSNLEANQSEAKPHIVPALVVSIRDMLAIGLVVIRDGQITPKEK
jgi:hypothetical protein